MMMIIIQRYWQQQRTGMRIESILLLLFLMTIKTKVVTATMIVKEKEMNNEGSNESNKFVEEKVVTEETISST